jgi:hypothetical protein
VERSGKCFCPPFAPQRDRDYKGRGTPFPVCARLLTACLRCTSLWHCAGLPVGIARCAETIDPGSKGCASHTRPGVGHLTGGLTVPCDRAAKARTVIHDGFETRDKCAVGNIGSGPIGSAKVVRPSFDPLRSTRLDVSSSSGITAQGHWLTPRWLTRRSVVLLASSLSASCQ